MTERFEDTDGVFTPVIFDEAETEFIMNPVGHFGRHFRDRVSEVPTATEGMKLEVADEAMARFVRDCLLYRDEGLVRIIDSYHRGVELEREYGRRRFWRSNHENMRIFITKSEDKMRMSQQLIGRLGLGGAGSE